MSKAMVPLSKRGRSRCRRSRAHKIDRGSGRKIKPVKLLETLRIMAARASNN
jgi:hypothetical protein